MRAIVVGGAGALGRAVVGRYAAAGWHVVSIDFGANDEASQSLHLSKEKSWNAQATEIAEMLKEKPADLVFCAAGGWAGGSVESAEGLEGVEQMYKVCVQSAVTAAHIGTQTLNPKGLLVFTGATAALSPDCTAGMIGYGLAKSATHHLVQSLGASSEDSGLPGDVTVLGVLPTTIDTEMNRKFMPDADFSTWTPTDDIAKKLLSWSTGAETPPKSGTLVKMETADFKTKWVECS